MMTKALKGSIRVPSDKSLSHRVALFSAMAEGSSHVFGLLDSLDVHATLGAIEALGAKVELTPGEHGLCGTITGWGAAGPALPFRALQCGNSGTTARLLLGILSGYDVTACLIGDASLSKRPMSRVTVPLSMMGASFKPCGESVQSDTSQTQDKLPLNIQGKALLKAIEYISPVASAQVKSAILLAGLHADGKTRVTEPFKSRDHTELLLPAYGVAVETNAMTTGIQGGQQLLASDCSVPGDPSSAAFLLVAAALIEGSAVTINDVLLNPTRTGFIDVMRRMGADIEIKVRDKGNLGAEHTGDITVRYSTALLATTVKAHEVASLIDEVPIMALLATTASGETVFEQVGELRHKESDRLAAIVSGLTRLGFEAYELGDDLHVRSGRIRPADTTPLTLETFGDHRLAMSWSIAALAFDQKLNILDLESSGVSYPGFFADLEYLSA